MQMKLVDEDDTSEASVPVYKWQGHETSFHKGRKKELVVVRACLTRRKGLAFYAKKQ